MDVLDLEDNTFKTLPVWEVLGPDFPALRVIASIDKGDYLQDILSTGLLTPDDRLVLTFDALMKDSKFVKLMRFTLMRLEKAYGRPVDVEFTVEITPGYGQQEYKLHILQCRPLSQRVEDFNIIIPKDIPEEDILFTSHWLVPPGKALNIRYVVFVDPLQYRAIPELTIKHELGRAICRLNERLQEERFILMGPGRWGSANVDLGVHVTYGDIFNTKALIEVGVAKGEKRPDLSYGTHFFNDLVETGIHALSIFPDGELGEINWPFFRESPSCLAALSPDDARLEPYLRVIDVPAVANGRFLHILMDGKNEEAIGYLDEANPKTRP